MAETLAILNLHHYGMLHYLEQRDEGIFHVFKSLSRDNHYLDLIAQSTQFSRDKNLLVDNFSISCQRIPLDDVNKIKQILPEYKTHKLNRHDVTYDNRTQKIDTKNLSFSEYNPLRPANNPYCERVKQELSYTINGLAHVDVVNAYDRFTDGELSRDTLPLWKLYFKGESHRFTSEDQLKKEPWATLLPYFEDDIKLTLHPGYYFGKKITDPDARDSADYSYDVFLPNEGDDPVPVGAIEAGRSFDKNLSSLSVWHELPISPRFRYMTGIINPDSNIEIPTKKFHYLLKVQAQLKIMASSLVDVRLQSIQDCQDFSMNYLAQLKALSAVAKPTDKSDNSLGALKTHAFYRQGNNKLPEFAEIEQRIDALFTDAVNPLFITQINALGNTYSDESLASLRGLLTDFIEIHNNIMNDNTNKIDEFKFKLNNEDELDLALEIVSHFGRKHVAKNPAYEHFTVLFDRFFQQKKQQELAAIEDRRELSRISLLNNTPTVALDEKEKKQHTDVGVKIGGAKKDTYSRITSTNLAELTFQEKIFLISKEKVWPQPKWQSLIETEGMGTATALAIKTIRDVISKYPEMSSSASYFRVKGKNLLDAKTDADVDNWVKAIELVRDAVMPVRNLEDLRKALDSIKSLMEEPINPSERYKNRKSTTYYFRDNDDISYGDALGNAVRAKGGFDYLQERLCRAEYRVDDYGVDWVKAKVFKIKPKRTNDNDQGETNNTSEADEQPAKAKMPYPEHLEHIVREGHDWRDGKDIDGEALLNTFGFKGIEYGNWVSNAERQLVLNHAYDAFMDLAHAIGLGTDNLHMISMAGELSIGFGSRGKGRACAHYEPPRRVINITKIKGAGSLAHEWMHALDHYVGNLTGIRGKNMLFSESIVSAFDGVEGRVRDIEASHKDIIKYVNQKLQDKNLSASTQALAEQLGLLVFLSMYTNKTEQEVEKSIDEYILKSAKHTASWSLYSAQHIVKTMIDRYGVNEDTPNHAVDIKADEVFIGKLKESIKNRESGVTFCKAIVLDAVLKRLPHLEDRLTELGDLIKEHLIFDCKGQPEASRSVLINNLSAQDRDLNLIVKSSFFNEARMLDNIKPDSQAKAKYWSQPCELAARSFAVYIYDELNKNDCRSDYLVRGAKALEFGDKTVYKANCNPEGHERAILNKQFDALNRAVFVHALEQKQADEVDLSPC